MSINDKKSADESGQKAWEEKEKLFLKGYHVDMSEEELQFMVEEAEADTGDRRFVDFPKLRRFYNACSYADEISGNDNVKRIIKHAPSLTRRGGSVAVKFDKKTVFSKEEVVAVRDIIDAADDPAISALGEYFVVDALFQDVRSSEPIEPYAPWKQHKTVRKKFPLTKWETAKRIAIAFADASRVSLPANCIPFDEETGEATISLTTGYMVALDPDEKEMFMGLLDLCDSLRIEANGTIIRMDFVFGIE